MKRFLLIDDDKHEHMLINYLLKDRYQDSYQLTYVRNVEEAQAHLSTKGVDTILLDDKLENGMTSADSIPLIQTTAFNVPIIIISKDVNGKHLKDRIRFGIHKVVDKFKFKNELARGLLD